MSSERIDRENRSGETGDETSSRDTHTVSLVLARIRYQASRCATPAVDRQFRIAGWRVCLVIFETVQILISFAACFAFVWLFFFHTQCSFVWNRGIGIDNRKRTICIIMKSLTVVTMLQIR